MVHLKKQSHYAGLRPEIRNELKGYDLKKQSQFYKGENDVNPTLTMAYGILGSLR